MDTRQVREALSTFKELFEDGIISQSEYDGKRAEVLDKLTQKIGGLKGGSKGQNASSSSSAPSGAAAATAHFSGGGASTLDAQLAAILESPDLLTEQPKPPENALGNELANLLDSPDFMAEVTASTSAAPVNPEKAVADEIGYSNRKCVATLAGHTNYVFSLGVVGAQLYSGSGDNTIKSWDLQTLQCTDTHEGHKAAVCCLEVAGKTLFSGSWDNSIKVWDTRKKTCAHTLTNHTNYVSALCFEGNNLWSGSWDCTINLWDIRTWQPKSTIMKGGAVSSAGSPSFGHGGAISTLKLGPDGYLISGSYDKTIKVWDRRTLECRKTLEGHNNWIYSIDTTAERGTDGYTLWSSSRDHTIKTWDTKNFTCTNTFTDHTDNVTHLAVDQNIVYSSCMDKTIKARDAKTGRVCQTLTGHTNNVFTILSAYNTLYSGSWDKTIKIWQ